MTDQFTSRSDAASTVRTEEVLCSSRMTPRKTKLSSHEQHMLRAGIAWLHEELVVRRGVDVTELPKNAKGARFLQRSFFERLLKGYVHFQSCMNNDVSAAQLDIRLLTKYQMLQIRANTLDFTLAQSDCCTLSAHNQFLSSVDQQLYVGLAKGFLLGEFIPPREDKLAHEHPLKLHYPSTSAWVCDGCCRQSRAFPDMRQYKCTLGCDFDLCHQCLAQKEDRPVDIDDDLGGWVVTEKLPGSRELGNLGIQVVRVLGAVEMLSQSQDASGPQLPVCWMLQLDEECWHRKGVALLHTKELWLRILEGGSSELARLAGGSQVCVACDSSNLGKVQWDLAVFDPEEEGALEKMLMASQELTATPLAPLSLSAADWNDNDGERSPTPRMECGGGAWGAGRSGSFAGPPFHTAEAARKTGMARRALGDGEGGGDPCGLEPEREPPALECGHVASLAGRLGPQLRQCRVDRPSPLRGERPSPLPSPSGSDARPLRATPAPLSERRGDEDLIVPGIARKAADVPPQPTMLGSGGESGNTEEGCPSARFEQELRDLRRRRKKLSVSFDGAGGNAVGQAVSGRRNHPTASPDELDECYRDSDSGSDGGGGESTRGTAGRSGTGATGRRSGAAAQSSEAAAAQHLAAARKAGSPVNPSKVNEQMERMERQRKMARTIPLKVPDELVDVGACCGARSSDISSCVMM